jgi:hypothetical protein
LKSFFAGFADIISPPSYRRNHSPMKRLKTQMGADEMESIPENSRLVLREFVDFGIQSGGPTHVKLKVKREVEA